MYVYYTYFNVDHSPTQYNCDHFLQHQLYLGLCKSIDFHHRQMLLVVKVRLVIKSRTTLYIPSSL